jgi:hypothetical protein
MLRKNHLKFSLMASALFPCGPSSTLAIGYRLDVSVREALGRSGKARGPSNWIQMNILFENKFYILWQAGVDLARGYGSAQALLPRWAPWIEMEREREVERVRGKKRERKTKRGPTEEEERWAPLDLNSASTSNHRGLKHYVSCSNYTWVTHKVRS